MIQWLFESSGGLVGLTAFAAALVATVVWAAVWLAAVIAALTLWLALQRLPRMRNRKAQSAVH